jgi:hypothetical protein
MNGRNEKLWARMDALAGRFYPEQIRRFLTVRWMTVFVFLLCGVALLEQLLIPMPAPPGFVLHWLRSPLFLVPYDAVVLPLIWFVIAARPPEQYLYVRALIYGMLLAGILGQLMVLFATAKG